MECVLFVMDMLQRCVSGIVRLVVDYCVVVEEGIVIGVFI